MGRNAAREGVIASFDPKTAAPARLINGCPEIRKPYKKSLNISLKSERAKGQSG